MNLKFKGRFNDAGNQSGFGTKLGGSGREKLINEDGTFRIKKTGVPLNESFNIYHHLITISWTRFLWMILVGFIIVNALFAAVYFLLGQGQLSNYNAENSAFKTFLECFFFSAQTMSTVGYGRVAPIGLGANIIASIEALFGLLMFALATGILYGRFSRPLANIITSKNILIAPYKNITGLMFRISNKRTNQLMEPEVEVLTTLFTYENGVKVRKFYNLRLELKRVTFLSLSWTVVHPIDEDSPFYGLSVGEIKEADPEVMILFKAIDDTFSQQVHSRFSYRFEEFVFGAKFVSMFVTDESGLTILDLRKINDYEKASLEIQETVKIN